MYSLLVCDDNEKDREVIVKYASFEGYDIKTADNGMDAVRICRQKRFDLVLMDVMMPELDGFSAAKTIIDELDIPVIFVTKRDDEFDRIHGFEIGCDDYVVKPFYPKELMLRVKVALRHHEIKHDEGHELIKLRGMVIDFTSMTVTIDGKKVRMAPKEYALFFYLVKNRNIALTRERLLTEVWGFDYYGDDRTLDTHIKMIRKALGDEYKKYIVTLKGLGYKFETN